VRVEDFDYTLPQELIALRPAEPRDSARLLVIDGMSRSDKIFTDLPPGPPRRAAARRDRAAAPSPHGAILMGGFRKARQTAEGA
jgi:hypothetical protein